VSESAFRAYAHRGGAREAPENSITAFQRAVDLGFDYLETDVRPTRDGVAVLHHDATLERTTDSRGPVRERSWADLARVRLADGSTPLRLEELLEAAPNAHITVDAKESGSVAAIADAVTRAGAYDRVCVTSFSRSRLTRLRALLPGVESGAHPWEVVRLRSRGGPLPRVSRVQIPTRAFGVTLAEPGFVRRAHEQGIAVDVWTVDDPALMGRLLDLGVDGIMTDSPSVLRTVLAAR
jgi:glycerophosphoryl diester phosphodiesterase